MPTYSRPALIITGAVGNTNADGVVFDYRKLGDTDWIVAAIEAPDTVRKVITDVLPNTQYEVGIRYKVRGIIGDRLELGPVTTGADSSADAIDDVTDPDVYTPDSIAQVLLPRVQAQDALWGALLAAVATLDPQPAAGSAIDLAMAAVVTARAAAALVTGPIFADPTSWVTIDHEDLNARLEAVDAALADLDGKLKTGAIVGSNVANVPAEEVADAAIVAAKSADELVAAGALTWRAQIKVADDFSALVAEVARLVDRAALLARNSGPLQAALASLYSLLTAHPSFGNTGVAPVTLDNAQWVARKAAVVAAIKALGDSLDTLGAGLEPRAIGDWTFSGVTMTGDDGAGVGFGYTAKSYRSPQVAVKLLQGDILVGFRKPTDPMNADAATVVYGVRLRASDDKVLVKVEGAEAAYSAEAWPAGAAVTVAMFDNGIEQSVSFSVAGSTVPSASAVNGAPGQQWVPVIILEDADSAFQNLTLKAASPIPYTAVIGGPPANATSGGNVVGDVEASGATGPDAAGYYSFAGNNAKLFLVGDATTKTAWGGEPFLKVTVDLKDDTGVGDFVVAVICDTASSGTVARSVNARTGGTIAMPLGTTAYSAVLQSDFTSGSAKARKPALFPTQDAGPASGDGGGAVNNDGISGTQFSWFASSPFAGWAGEGEDPDSGTFRFVAEDVLGFFSGSVPGGTASSFSPTFAAKYIVVRQDVAAAQATGVGTLTLRVMTSPAGSSPVINTYNITPGVGSSVQTTIDIPPGHTLYRAEIVADMASGYLRTPGPEITLRNVVTLAELDPAAGDQLDGVAGVDVQPEYLPDMPAPSSYVNRGYTVNESWRADKIDLPVADVAQMVLVESKVTKFIDPETFDLDFTKIHTVKQTATDKGNVVWTRIGSVDMGDGDPNTWGAWEKSLSTAPGARPVAGEDIVGPPDPAAPDVERTLPIVDLVGGDTIAAAASQMLPNYSFDVANSRNGPAGIRDATTVVDEVGRGSEATMIRFKDGVRGTLELKGRHPNDDLAYVAAGFPAMKIDDRQIYRFAIRHSASAASAIGLFLRLYERDTALRNGATHVGNDDGRPWRDFHTSFVDLVINGPMPGPVPVAAMFDYIPTPGTRFASFNLFNWGSDRDYWVDFVQTSTRLNPARVDATELLNGPVEANADVTLTNFPVVEDIEPITIRISRTTNLPIGGQLPVFRKISLKIGGVDMSPSASFALMTDGSVTAAIDNTAGSIARGEVTLTAATVSTNMVAAVTYNGVVIRKDILVIIQLSDPPPSEAATILNYAGSIAATGRITPWLPVGVEIGKTSVVLDCSVAYQVANFGGVTSTFNFTRAELLLRWSHNADGSSAADFPPGASTNSSSQAAYNYHDGTTQQVRGGNVNNGNNRPLGSLTGGGTIYLAAFLSGFANGAHSDIAAATAYLYARPGAS